MTSQNPARPLQSSRRFGCECGDERERSWERKLAESRQSRTLPRSRACHRHMLCIVATTCCRFALACAIVVTKLWEAHELLLNVRGCTESGVLRGRGIAAGGLIATGPNVGSLSVRKKTVVLLLCMASSLPVWGQKKRGSTGSFERGATQRARSSLTRIVTSARRCVDKMSTTWLATILAPSARGKAPFRRKNLYLQAIDLDRPASQHARAPGD